jgi:hypothetical protein
MSQVTPKFDETKKLSGSDVLGLAWAQSNSEPSPMTGLGLGFGLRPGFWVVGGIFSGCKEQK